jgi:hypothetical protein
MDELAELAALRAGVTGQRAEDLEGAWGLLLAEMRVAGTPGRVADHARARPGPGKRLGRRRLWLAGAAVAASVVTAGLLVWPASDSTPPGGSVLTVAYVLDNAARAAASSRQPVPRPDQYIHVSSVTTDLAVDEDPGGGKAYLYSTDRRIWLSVSGGQAGVLWERQLPNKKLPWGPTPPPVTGASVSWTPLSAPGTGARDTYQFLTTLPTDPGQLRAWIYRHLDGQQPADEQAWTDIGDMVREMLVPAKLAAALFRVAATIPGAQVIPHVTNVLGRPGIAVARYDPGFHANAALIFDRRTYQLLGEGEVLTSPVQGEGPAGTVIAATAQLSATVVDHLPSHSR